MNEREISALYRQWGPVVYRRCLRVLRDPEEARDATQHVFLQLLRHRERFDGDPAEAIAWIQRVATNASLSRVRERRRRGKKLEALEHDAPLDPPPDEALRDRDAARRVLDHADAPSRELALSVLVGDQSHEEAAARLGVSTKTVQRRLRDFVERARRLLEGGGR